MYIIRLPRGERIVPIRPPFDFFIVKRRRRDNMGTGTRTQKRNVDKEVSQDTGDSFGTSVEVDRE